MAKAPIESALGETPRPSQELLSDAEFENLWKYAEDGDVSTFVKVFAAHARGISEPANRMGGRHTEIQFEGLILLLTGDRLNRFIDSHPSEDPLVLLERLKSVLDLLWKAAPQMSHSLSGRSPFNTPSKVGEVYRWQQSISGSLSSVRRRMRAISRQARGGTVGKPQSNPVKWSGSREQLQLLCRRLVENGAVSEETYRDGSLSGFACREEGHGWVDVTPGTDRTPNRWLDSRKKLAYLYRLLTTDRPGALVIETSREDFISAFAYFDKKKSRWTRPIFRRFSCRCPRDRSVDPGLDLRGRR